MRITEEELEAAKSPRGGWTRETLAQWGVPWPPPKGWRKELTGGPPRAPRGEKPPAPTYGPVAGTAIYTDGSCWPNPGPGGWAYVIPDLGVEKSGAEADTTNNRMEMRAIIEALRGSTGEVTIHSDSNVCINTLQGNWKVRANKDLVAEAWTLMAGRVVHFRWVRGHVGDVHNERCDVLAGEARVAGCR